MWGGLRGDACAGWAMPSHPSPRGERGEGATERSEMAGEGTCRVPCTAPSSACGTFSPKKPGEKEDRPGGIWRRVAACVTIIHMERARLVRIGGTVAWLAVAVPLIITAS